LLDRLSAGPYKSRHGVTTILGGFVLETIGIGNAEIGRPAPA
jgi:hypothetical protein